MWQGPTVLRPQRPTKQLAPAPLGRNSASLEGQSVVLTRLRLARGLDAPSGETPPRSRAGHSLGRNSASLEGWTPPRARLRLARGSHGLAAPTPAPRTGAFNVLTRTGVQVKDESVPYRPSDTAWESYPGAVSQTLPVRPSPQLYDTVR
jgi:hypothetical protein